MDEFVPHMEEEETTFQPLLSQYFHYDELKQLKVKMSTYRYRMLQLRFLNFAFVVPKNKIRYYRHQDLRLYCNGELFARIIAG